MLNQLMIWIVAHPLEFVALMAGSCGVGGVLLIPRIREVCDHGHPRI